MEADKIMNADLLDLLFEGKNKAYGAYDLRKTYNKRITAAMGSMAFVCLLFFISRILANNSHEKSKLVFTVVTLANLPDHKEKLPEPIHVKPPKAVPQVKTTQFATFRIVKDDLVKDPPPDIEKLVDTQIGLENLEGTKEIGFAAPPVEQSTGVTEVPKKEVEDYDKVFKKVEIEAKFPGGMEGWKRYLERNLNANVASDDGAVTGNYTVKVQFIVDREGGISNVQAVEVPNACPSCGLEAVKIIKKGPKWEPAIQNGRTVIYQAVQYVTFQVAEQ